MGRRAPDDDNIDGGDKGGVCGQEGSGDCVIGGALKPVEFFE